MNRLITASSDPFFLQGDSRISNEGAIAGSKTSALGRPSQQPILRPPWGLDPSACGLFQPGYRSKNEEFSLLPVSTESACASRTVSGRFWFPDPARGRQVLDFTKPLLYTLFLGSEYAVNPAERREELRYDEGGRKGVGSEVRLHSDSDPAMRFRGFPGPTGESPDDRFPFGR